jgi:trans-aconitate 2-methyltransferase
VTSAGTGGWNARDYADNSSAQATWAAELIEKLRLQPSESLLDIGCGNGAVTSRLATRLTAGRVLGIDSSEDMIRLAESSYPGSRHPNLSFLRMDAAAIRLPRQFDVAFSNATLHWVADQPAVLRGVRSCLRPGGRVLFQMGGRGNAGAVVYVVRALVAEPRWRRYFDGFVAPYHFYGPEQYRDWLAESGLEALRVELVPKDMRHPNPAGLRGWLRTTWFPYTDALPLELRDRFLDEILAAYLDRVPPERDGGTHVAMMRLEVEARLLTQRGEATPPGVADPR